MVSLLVYPRGSPDFQNVTDFLILSDSGQQYCDPFVLGDDRVRMGFSLVHVPFLKGWTRE